MIVVSDSFVRKGKALVYKNIIDKNCEDLALLKSLGNLEIIKIQSSKTGKIIEFKWKKHVYQENVCKDDDKFLNDFLKEYNIKEEGKQKRKDINLYIIKYKSRKLTGFSVYFVLYYPRTGV